MMACNSALFARRRLLTAVSTLVVCLMFSCRPAEQGKQPAQSVPQLQTNGTVEVTAKLVEVPDGAIFKRDLYDYATVLKYQVLKVHRGEVKAPVILVGQYNPFKPRREAADGRVKLMGGTVDQFRAGEIHHLALEVPIEDHFMGGIVNKYFDPQSKEPIYWAIWTNLE